VCHTIHNFKHQGHAGVELLHLTGLGRPEHFFSLDRLRDDGNPFALNFTKGAIVYSNFVTTVSPQHAWEARHTAEGYGLGDTLHKFQDKFGGVLNGLDDEMWNPEADPHIAQHFSAESIDLKQVNKEALRARFRLNAEDKPLLSYVGRLDTQKGLHLIRHSLFYSIWNGAQFVLLGVSPELGINDEFWHIKHYLSDNRDCHLEIGFDEELAHLIYAGSDMMTVPSMYEPCGLTQMIALRYGSVPVVRSVGGLRDTVFDWDYSDKPAEERDGFVFEHPNYEGLESALRRAFGLWSGSPELFRELQQNGMRCDYSWNHPGQYYLNIYEYIRDK